MLGIVSTQSQWLLSVVLKHRYHLAFDLIVFALLFFRLLKKKKKTYIETKEQWYGAMIQQVSLFETHTICTVSDKAGRPWQEDVIITPMHWHLDKS